MNNSSIILLIFSIFSLKCFSQDFIILRNGEEIKAKVTEIGVNEIKYIKIEYPDSPIYTIKKNNVTMIKYSNGNKDIFKDTTNIKKNNERDKIRYYSLACGLGTSYGLLGLKFQGRTGGKYGIGYHIGAGTSFRGLGANIGFKIYPYKWFYLNPQIGIMFKQSYVAFLIGGDWFFNKHIGLNCGLGILNYLFYYRYSSIREFDFDIGLIYKL